MLKSSRPVVVIGSEYQRSYLAYYKAQRTKNPQRMAENRTKLLSIIGRDPIKPGARCVIAGSNKLNLGDYPGRGRFAANVNWLPATDFLTVKATVTDRFFAPAGAGAAPEEGSSLQLFISPSGSGTDVSAITIVPAGTAGKAGVSMLCGEYGPASADKDDCVKIAKQVTASWKRTRSGYSIDARIPWKILRGYHAGWKIMPVDAAINTRVDEEKVQLTMNRLGDPLTEPFIYAGLKPK